MYLFMFVRVRVRLCVYVFKCARLCFRHRNDIITQTHLSMAVHQENSTKRVDFGSFLVYVKRFDQIR